METILKEELTQEELTQEELTQEEIEKEDEAKRQLLIKIREDAKHNFQKVGVTIGGKKYEKDVEVRHIVDMDDAYEVFGEEDIVNMLNVHYRMSQMDKARDKYKVELEKTLLPEQWKKSKDGVMFIKKLSDSKRTCLFQLLQTEEDKLKYQEELIKAILG